MTIAILVPTKGRPQQFRRMVESADKMAHGHINIEVGAIPNDVPYELPPLTKTTVIPTNFPDGLPTVHKWNALAEPLMRNPENKLFMLGADDIVFATPLFDKALIDCHNALENKIHVFALLDSRDPDGVPHPIVTREWIEFFGWAFPPIFVHWMLDTWTVEIAKSAGCFTHLKDYLVIHDKCNDKGNPDETHNGIRRSGWRERDAFVAKSCTDWLELQKKKLGEKCASL